MRIIILSVLIFWMTNLYAQKAESIGKVEIQILNSKTNDFISLGDSISTTSISKSKLMFFDQIIAKPDTLSILSYNFSAASLGGDEQIRVNGFSINSNVKKAINGKGVYICAFEEIVLVSATGKKYKMQDYRMINTK